jgi:hypothetical protein
MPQFLATIAMVSLMIAALPAQASVEGTYRLNSLGCRMNSEVVPNCNAGEKVSVEKTSDGDYKILEINAGKSVRSWFVSARSISSDNLVLTTFVKVSETSLEYSEDRTIYFPGDSRRQFYKTYLTLRENSPGRYTMKVRSSQIRETAAELTEAGVSELAYDLSK